MEAIRPPGGGRGGGGARGRGGSRRKVRTDDCSKTRAVFKCTRDECGSSWTSYHGWLAVSSYHEDCPGCPNSNNVRVTNVVEGMARFEVYTCPNCTRPFFAVPEPNPNPLVLPIKKCPREECGIYSGKTGEQERVGRQVTFACGNQDCNLSWTSPYFGVEYSQRCKKCQNKGKIIGTKLIDPKGTEDKDASNASGSGGRSWLGRGGVHDKNGCDMCLRIGDCTRKRRVIIKETTQADGTVHSDIQPDGRPDFPSGRGGGPRRRRRPKPPKPGNPGGGEGCQITTLPKSTKSGTPVRGSGQTTTRLDTTCRAQAEGSLSIGNSDNPTKSGPPLNPTSISGTKEENPSGQTNQKIKCQPNVKLSDSAKRDTKTQPKVVASGNLQKPKSQNAHSQKNQGLTPTPGSSKYQGRRKRNELALKVDQANANIQLIENLQNKLKTTSIISD